MTVRKCLLDSDILSELAKKVDKIVLARTAEYLNFHPFLSFTSVSVYEIPFGLKSKSAANQAKSFLDLVSDHEEIVPEREDYRIAADIKAALKLIGKPISAGDPIIAACAFRRDLPLVTGNTKHYRFVNDVGFPLYLLNWREASES